MAIPKTQNAIVQPDKMSTAVIMTTDHPVPTANLSTTEHLIRVHTAAITNGELLWTKNFPIAPEFAALKVLVPCDDVAGTVVTAPPTSPFQPGTEVYARSSYNRTGCAREYTILLTEEMARRPQKLSWAESATVPMSAETAWQALFIHAGLEAKAGQGGKGKRVFVTAASGGVGVWMVQLAKWAGAEVIATCGPDSVEWVRSLGADEVIDYTKTHFKEWASGEGKKVDLVIDCIGRKSLEDAWWVVKDGGVLISIFQPPEQMRPVGVEGNIRNSFFVMASNGKELQKVTELIEAGVVSKVALDSVFPLDRFQEAFKKLESGRTRGKVVLDLGVN
jgi:NADPH:quinone reductase-like Zn-dependent oxidoreductase